MKSPPKEAYGVFQMYPPVLCLNFSNNILVTLVRAKISEGEHYIF